MKTRLMTLIAAFAYTALCLQAQDTTPVVDFSLLPQVGHTNAAGRLAFSADGKNLASISGRQLLVWDLASCKEVKSLYTEDPDASFSCIAFAAVRGRLLAGCSDGSVMEFDLLLDQRLLYFRAHTDSVNCIVPSPGGSTFATGSDDTTLKTWSLDSGAMVRDFQGNRGGVNAAVWLPDGSGIVSGSGNGELKLWDPATGTETGSFAGHGKSITSLALSTNGKVVFSGSSDRTVKTWAVDSGKELFVFDGYASFVNTLAVVPPSSLLVSSSFEGDSLRIFDLQTGKVLREIKAVGMNVHAAAVSADGRLASISSGFGDLGVWDIGSGSRTANLDTASTSVNSAAFSPADDRMVSGGMDEAVKVWDRSACSLSKVNTDNDCVVQEVGFFPGGGRVYSVADYGEYRLWNLETGDVFGFLDPLIAALPDTAYEKLVNSWIHSAALSPDGNALVVCGSDGKIKFFDTRSGALLAWYSDESAQPTAGTVHAPSVGSSTEVKLAVAFDSVAYAPDGRTVMAARRDALGLFDPDTGVVSTTLDYPRADVTTAVLSPDGLRALTGHSDGHVEFRDLRDGRLVVSLSSPDAGIESLAVSRDGTRALSGSGRGTIVLWDLASGRAVRQLSGHSGRVTSLSFSGDGETALSSSGDGSIRLWDLSSGAWVAFVADEDGRRWLVYTDDGFWDGSPDCGELVAMVSGLETWNIDQFAARNNRPDIILERLGSTDAALIRHYRDRYLKRLRRLGLTEADLTADWRVPKAEITAGKQDGKFADLELRFTANGKPLARYQVWVNDVPLFGAFGKPVGGSQASARERVELGSGDNKIEASCMDSGGAESFRVPAYLGWDGETQPDLYFIGFGVSKYRNPDFDLDWAAQDILDLKSRFQAMEGKGFRKVYATSRTDDEVTPSAIRKAKTLLANARPDDVFVLAISGHGLHDTDRESTYYFLTHDADLSNLAQTAADFDLVEDLLQGIGPRKKLFLMDTCESGEADGGALVAAASAGGKGVRARTTRSGITLGKKSAAVTEALRDQGRYIYNDLVRRSGAIVFSSCRGGELSYELDELRNGAFTEAVLAALSSPAADANGDGIADTTELRAYQVDNALARRHLQRRGRARARRARLRQRLPHNGNPRLHDGSLGRRPRLPLGHSDRGRAVQLAGRGRDRRPVLPDRSRFHRLPDRPGRFRRQVRRRQGSADRLGRPPRPLQRSQRIHDGRNDRPFAVRQDVEVDVLPPVPRLQHLPRHQPLHGICGRRPQLRDRAGLFLPAERMDEGTGNIQQVNFLAPARTGSTHIARAAQPAPAVSILFNVAYSLEKESIVSLSLDDLLMKWDVSSGQPLVATKFESALAISQDGNYLLFGRFGGMVLRDQGRYRGHDGAAGVRYCARAGAHEERPASDGGPGQPDREIRLPRAMRLRWSGSMTRYPRAIFTGLTCPEVVQ
ncbi:MAG: caspase family protein [Spirochaetes bacterium]|nr:caspase family protein [Spirochaetota bacterium]